MLVAKKVNTLSELELTDEEKAPADHYSLKMTSRHHVR